MQRMSVNHIYLQWPVLDCGFHLVKVDSFLPPWNTFTVGAFGDSAIVLGIEQELDMLLVCYSLIQSGRVLAHLHMNYEIGIIRGGARKDWHAKDGMARCLKTEQIEHGNRAFCRGLRWGEDLNNSAIHTSP